VVVFIGTSGGVALIGSRNIHRLMILVSQKIVVVLGAEAEVKMSLETLFALSHLMLLFE
jgi:hypothetical protein